MTLKRFALFGGDTYYPEGGFSDLVDDADSVDELIKLAEAEAHDWAHIADLETCKLVWARHTTGSSTWLQTLPKEGEP